MEIEFHDREKEIDEIIRILSYRPDSIYFVYGPINSGKTELFQHLIKSLPKEYKAFYVNLRGVYVSKAEDFLTVLFDVEEKEYDLKDFLKVLIDYLPEKVELPLLGRVPVPKNLFKKFFEEKGFDNAFKYLEALFLGLSRKFKPILIVDELQVIGDLKVDGFLIYKFFNLLVHLTKELHCCHVFAVTSDSLFMERVFNEAMLQGRCDYLLVDDFDYDTTADFLKKYGFNDDEIQLVWDYFGGKPVYLVKAVKNKHKLKRFCEETLEDQISSLLYRIKALRREDENLFQKVINLFEQFRESETTKCDEISEEIIWTVKSNILFLDPRKRLLKPQSKLDLLAIRRILEELN
jgi:AAA+ ATPase superfamily predicted ATPase